MEERDWLAQRFEENRGHLRAVSYRMLGSLTEADDAVQEAWLRLSRAEPGSIDNLGGWLTTVVARVCLDMLRSRTSRREEPLGERTPEPAGKAAGDPEHEAVMADSVGLALLVVLERLTPAERLAFVLHDLFAVSFSDIGAIVGRTADAARRRVRGAAPTDADLAGQKKVIDSFLAALRAGDVEALVAVLDPDFVMRADAAAVPPGGQPEVRGPRVWAEQAIPLARGARAARAALVDGNVGVVIAPRGRLFRVLKFTTRNGKITAIEVVGDPARLRELDLAVLG